MPSVKTMAVGVAITLLAIAAANYLRKANVPGFV